jgi:hypothetical protein
MTSRNNYVVYTSLPPNPNSTAQNVVVLPLYHLPTLKSRRICQFLTFFTALLLVSLLYPSKYLQEHILCLVTTTFLNPSHKKNECFGIAIENQTVFHQGTT